MKQPSIYLLRAELWSYLSVNPNHYEVSGIETASNSRGLLAGPGGFRPAGRRGRR